MGPLGVVGGGPPLAGTSPRATMAGHGPGPGAGRLGWCWFFGRDLSGRGLAYHARRPPCTTSQRMRGPPSLGSRQARPRSKTKMVATQPAGCLQRRPWLQSRACVLVRIARSSSDDRSCGDDGETNTEADASAQPNAQDAPRGCVHAEETENSVEDLQHQLICRCRRRPCQEGIHRR